VVDDAFDTAAGVSGVSLFRSVSTGNGDNADSACPITVGDAVSETSSIDGHDVVPAGTLFSLSFSAFSANCLLHVKTVAQLS